MKMLLHVIWILFYLHGLGQPSPVINPVLLNNSWNAYWISCPDASSQEYGVFHFRKRFELSAKPKQFIVHVSADNRYKLFVNGKGLCNGPARGELAHWNFETIDIAAYLDTGKNIVAATVWNFGAYKPLAQISAQTAFILQGNSKLEEIVNTNESWRVSRNLAYKPSVSLPKKTVTGPGDFVDASMYPYGFADIDFDDIGWKTPEKLQHGIPYGKSESWIWMLVPRSIPFMEEKLQRFNDIRRTENITIDKRFLKGGYPLVVPAKRKIKFLIDQGFLTSAYIELQIKGGSGAVVELKYAEALFDANEKKGNRNIITNKKIISDISDVFLPDGGERLFRPLQFRTFRYVEVAIETKEDPLVLPDLYGIFTAYPFHQIASFKSSDPELQDIWKVGWRTARLCAAETYFDCPYYEQLQYIGDTRIQSLVSLYVSGDDRLMRNAIEQFHQSLLPNGLTQSRYPSSQPQVIPPFSLYWIDMVHDFWMLRNDTNFIKRYLGGVRNILAWYENNIARNKMLGPLDWWNFVDWSFGAWSPDKPVGGTPNGAMEGGSSIITLQYAYTLQSAAEMFAAFGDSTLAKQYLQLSGVLIKNTIELCWDYKDGMMADTPEKSSFSQHANVMAILSGGVGKERASALIQKILNEKDIIPCSYYYQFYLDMALEKAGMADKYLSLLDPWKNMLRLGLTTFAEKEEPTRSDCHAWSASPNYYLLSLVSGIKPSSPGFRTVCIKPFLGSLSYIDVIMPHPSGTISVQLRRRDNNGVEGIISLPYGITGNFIWMGKEMALVPGKQIIKM